nr:hypothetical protein BaRGS_017296 [Batillaria attramentaria]
MESLMEEAGSSGRFQVMMTAALKVGMMPIAWSMMQMAFAGLVPDWWCLPPAADLGRHDNLSWHGGNWSNHQLGRYDNVSSQLGRYDILSSQLGRYDNLSSQLGRPDNMSLHHNESDYPHYSGGSLSPVESSKSSGFEPFVSFIPESARWLAAKGRLEEAEAVVERVASVNGRPKPNDTLSRLRAVAEEERQAGQGRRYTYLDVYRGWRMASTTLVLNCVWFSLTFSYYGISFGVSALSGNVFLNIFLMTLVEIPSNFISVFMSDKFVILT